MGVRTWPNYIEVARLDELPAGQGTVVTIANRDVALFNVDGTIYAMANACLHQGQSLGSAAPSTARSSPAAPTVGATT